MHLDEALEVVQAGGRIKSASIPSQAVVKLEHNGWKPTVRVVFEATGDGYNFQNSPYDKAADWHGETLALAIEKAQTNA